MSFDFSKVPPRGNDLGSDFLPSDYQVPAGGGNYMKLIEGQNKFRILSSAITGYEYWTQDKKPVRSKQFPTSTPNIKTDMAGKPERPKHFWAFVVWNYSANAVQILQITQSTIQSGIKALVDNPEWGDPKKYNITISRSGEGLNSEYTVMPNPHSELPDEAKKLFEDTTIDLNALYAGADPFDPNWVAMDAVPKD